MTDILKCDLCGADAGNDPYHITFMGDGHVHVCSDCFDPQQHDVGVLKQQRDGLLTELKATESRLHEVSTFCATVWQQRDELLEALRGLRDAFIGTSVEVQADAMRAARAAIAKAGGES